MKNTISAKQLQSVVSLFLFGSSLLTGASAIAKQDTWFCIICGFLLSIFLVWVHTGILNLYPGRDYYGNVLSVFGKVVGRVVLVIYSLYALHLGGEVLRTFAEFIHLVNMTETPLISISAIVVAVMVYVLKSRVYVLARVCKFVLPLIFVSVALTVALSIKDMDFKNIQPMLRTGADNIFPGMALFFTLPFGEIVACAPIFGELDRKQRVFPVFLKGAFSGFLVILVANLRNLLVLGYSAQIYPFASYESVSVIAYGEFFTRIEALIGINLLLAGFVKVCVLIFSAASGLAKLFDLEDYIPLVAPCGFLVLTVSLTVHTDMSELYGWMKYNPVYSVLPQIILPVLTLVVGVIRKKAKGKKAGKRPVPKKESDAGSAVPQS